MAATATVEKSLNGWPVIHSRASKQLATGTVPGTKIRLTCHKDALPVLLAVAAAVHETVCSLYVGNESGQDEGGYTYRAARGTTQWSNHASGTAIDLNWKRWLRLHRNMTKKERRAAQKIADRVAPVVTWGGTWDKLTDEHHFEVSKGVTVLKLRAWTKTNIGADGRLK
jgi:hypothetical protein